VVTWLDRSVSFLCTLQKDALCNLSNKVATLIQIHMDVRISIGVVFLRLPIGTAVIGPLEIQKMVVSRSLYLRTPPERVERIEVSDTGLL